MDLRFTAPWHRETYERFLKEYLPQLLGERLPLASYSAEAGGERTFTVRLSVRANGEEVSVPLVCRIDTLDELEYFSHGGILHYVLRKLAA